MTTPDTDRPPIKPPDRTGRPFKDGDRPVVKKSVSLTTPLYEALLELGGGRLSSGIELACAWLLEERKEHKPERKAQGARKG